MELADDGDVLDLLVGKLAVGAVDLGEDVAGIDEEDAVVGLGLVEEPERGRKRDGVEHVRGQRQHRVDEVLLDQGPADVGLGMAGVGGGVGHDERGAALRLQRSGKEIDPKVIRVRDGFLALVLLLRLGLLARDAVGVEALVLLHAAEADVVHVERRIGEDVVERAETAEGIVVVGVGLLDFAAQAVHREVHLGEVDCLQRLLLSVNINAAVGVLEFLAVLLDEVRGLHEHAA